MREIPLEDGQTAPYGNPHTPHSLSFSLPLLATLYRRAAHTHTHTNENRNRETRDRNTEGKAKTEIER